MTTLFDILKTADETKVLAKYEVNLERKDEYANDKEAHFTKLSMTLSKYIFCWAI